jgi:hypothetical protein
MLIPNYKHLFEICMYVCMMSVEILCIYHATVTILF